MIYVRKRFENISEKYLSLQSSLVWNIYIYFSIQISQDLIIVHYPWKTLMGPVLDLAKVCLTLTRDIKIV